MGRPDYVIGDGPDPELIVQIDIMPPFTGLLGDGDHDTGEVKFQVYYDFGGYKIFSPWTRLYSRDERPVKLRWDEMWPKGDPVNN